MYTNNDKASTIKLTNEINETNNKLGERDNQRFKEIKENCQVQVEISTQNIVI